MIVGYERGLFSRWVRGDAPASQRNYRFMPSAFVLVNTERLCRVDARFPVLSLFQHLRALSRFTGQTANGPSGNREARADIARILLVVWRARFWREDGGVLASPGSVMISQPKVIVAIDAPRTGSTSDHGFHRSVVTPIPACER